MGAKTIQRKPENKERIRGPKLAVLVKKPKGVPFVEGLRMADEDGFVIASNARLDKALAGSDEWQEIKEGFPCWSGTMTAYKEPGKKLGETIEYVDPMTKERWIFRVPKKHQKRKNAILVAEHPNYTLEVDGKNIVVHATAIDLVKRFPASDGLYPTNESHSITSKRGSSNQRFLNRINRRVGPSARDHGFYSMFMDAKHIVDISFEPSGSLGIIVENTGDAN